MIKPKDFNDKTSWCEYGKTFEQTFCEEVAPCYGLNALPNPELLHNKYSPDLIIDGSLSDLKYRATPFFTARKYGLNPQSVVTIDEKDYLRYRRLYPNIAIYFWVDYTTNLSAYGVKLEPLQGLWKCSIGTLHELIVSEKAKLHQHKLRVNDTKGNAKNNFLLHLDWLTVMRKKYQDSIRFTTSKEGQGSSAFRSK